MSVRERLLHMILFELIALTLFVPLAMLATGGGALHMTALSVLLSLIAMVWNYLYNWIFDWLFGEDRIRRGLGLRIVHGTCFELGMIAATFPVIMLMLGHDFLTTLALNIGAVLFFLVYAVIFNWLYDVVRDARIRSAATSRQNS